MSRGTEPERFSVEVLGAMPDGLAPGRDMIVVEASGPAIERAGGIWFGMSGSPIYVGGRLLGALAHGLTGGPSTIAGVTPAEDLLDLRNYPVAPPGAVGSNASPPLDFFLFLSPGIVGAIAAETNTPVDEVGLALAPLRVPLGASGLSARGMKRLQRHVQRERLPYVPYATSSASPEAVASERDRLEPGDNFAAALSYGDITLTDVGTTSYVCEGRAVAFGHPLEFTGRTSMGASAAEAITVVRDPVYGPFKLAKLRGRVGRVDQDRFAGVRAILGEQPATIPIRTSIIAPDVGRTRAGATDVVLPPWAPFIAFLHLSENITSTADTAGGGASQVSWTVEGTRADGRPWMLSRSNHYASRSDIALESTTEFATGLDLIASNPFEDVRLRAVQAQAKVEEAVRQYRIARVLVAVNRGPFREVSVVRAAPGARLSARVFLAPSDDSPSEVIDIVLVVPRTARSGGQIDIVGAPTTQPVCFERDFCERGSRYVRSFDGMLAALQHRRRNNVLVGRLGLGFAGRIRDSARIVLDRQVYGSKTIGVKLGCCGSPSALPTESGPSIFDFELFGF